MKHLHSTPARGAARRCAIRDASTRRAGRRRTVLTLAVLAITAARHAHAASTTHADADATLAPTIAEASASHAPTPAEHAPPIEGNTPANGPPAGDGVATDAALAPVAVVGTVGPRPDADVAPDTLRADIALRDYPASIQVVPAEVLRERGVTRVDQLVDTVSGVHAEASYGGNGATFFNIRGFSESNGLRDGFRNYGYYAFRDVQNIERVDVFKGPAGALYGGIGAVGGYVDTVSKHPEWDDFGEVGASVGSEGLARTTLDMNRVLNEHVSVRLNAAVEKDTTFRDNAATRSWSVAPAIAWRDGSGTSLTLLTEFNHLRRDGFDFGIPAIADYQALSRTRYYGLRDGMYPGVAGDYGRNDTQAETLVFERVLTPAWKLRLSGQYTDARQFSTQSFPDSTVPTANLLDYSVYRNAAEESRQVALRAELVGDFFTGSLGHAVLAGVDFGYQEIGSQGSQVETMTLDLLHPGYLSGLTPGDPLPSHQGRGKDYGVYAQDLVTLTPQVKMLVGARADRFVNTAIESGAATGEGRQTAFSPRVGLVWQPTRRTAFFADWSLSHSPNVGHSGSNVTYEAEVARQVEVGVRHDLLADRLTASLALFDLNRNHILTTDPANPLLSVLTGAQRSRGVEIDITGRPTPRLKTIVTYAYTVARVTSDTTFPVGDILSNVPRHSASAWAVYQVPLLPGLQLGGGLVYVGAREATLPNSFKLPAYVRADAMAAYARGRWKTQLNVFNVFNRRYVTGGAAATFDYTLTPGPPLTAQVTVSYRF